MELFIIYVHRNFRVKNAVLEGGSAVLQQYVMQCVIPYIKQHVKQILLGITGILIIIGLILMWCAMAGGNNRNVIKLSIEDGIEQSITFEDLSMLPGESCAYTLRLSSKYADKYDLYLNFTELEEKTLKEFVYVRIESGDEILYEQMLKDAFTDDAICFSVDFSEARNTELNFIYYMPIEVGNEAQNAEAIFELLITASNE